MIEFRPAQTRTGTSARVRGNEAERVNSPPIFPPALRCYRLPRLQGANHLSSVLFPDPFLPTSTILLLSVRSMVTPSRRLDDAVDDDGAGRAGAPPATLELVRLPLDGAPERETAFQDDFGGGAVAAGRGDETVWFLPC